MNDSLLKSLRIVVRTIERILKLREKNDKPYRILLRLVYMKNSFCVVCKKPNDIKILKLNCENIRKKDVEKLLLDWSSDCIATM